MAPKTFYFQVAGPGQAAATAAACSVWTRLRGELKADTCWPRGVTVCWCRGRIWSFSARGLFGWEFVEVGRSIDRSLRGTTHRQCTHANATAGTAAAAAGGALARRLWPSRKATDGWGSAAAMWMVLGAVHTAEAVAAAAVVVRRGRRLRRARLHCSDCGVLMARLLGWECGSVSMLRQGR